MIPQLDIDLVLEFRIHKYFLKDENRLTLEKVKNDLNKICNLEYYDFSEDKEYIKFTIKNELIKDHLSLFLLRQCLYMLNNERFDECVEVEKKSSLEEKIEVIKNGQFKYIRYNPCSYIGYKMINEIYTYEIEYSSITFCDSNGFFVLEESLKFRKYLKSLIKCRYPELGDAVYIHYEYFNKEDKKNM